MILVILVLTCFAFSQVVVSQPEATFVCDANNQAIALTVPGTWDKGNADANDDITYAEAVVVGETVAGNCGSSTDNNGNFIFTITQGNCGTTLSGNQDTLVFTVNLVQNSGIYQENDWLFVISCNFNGEQTVQTANAITVNNNPGSGSSNEIGEGITLSVTASTLEDITTCDLGAAIKLKLDLVTSSTARGVYGIKCDAYPNADAVTNGSPTLGLIADRCGVASFAGAISTTTGFGNEITGNEANAANFISHTTSLKCFRFSGFPSLLIRCSVGFCATATEDKCATDNCNFPTGRRRRSFNNNTRTEEVVDVTIKIRPHSQKEDEDNAVKTDNQTGCTTFTHNTGFIAVVAVLATLLLLSMSATVYLAKRIRRARDDIPMKGVSNPAF